MEAPLEKPPPTQQILDSLPDAVVIVDRDGRMVVVNDKTEQLFGYRREELIHRPVELLVPERFRSGHPGHREGFFGNPHVRPIGAGLDLYARRRDGSEFPVEISISPMKADGQTLASTIIRDVTEPRRIVALLKEREAHLQLIFNSTSDGQMLFRVEPDGGLVTEAVNHAFSAMVKALVGTDITECLGKDAAALLAATGLPAEEIERRLSLYRKVARERASLRYRTPQMGNREPAEISVSPVVHEDGRCTHVLCTLRIETERVKAEAELREREESLRLIFNAHRDPQTLSRVEPGGRFVIEAFNQAMLDYAGKYIPNPFEFLGRGRDELSRALGIPENEIQRAMERWREAAAEKTPVRYAPSYAIGPGGRRREIGEISVVPILNRDGVCTHLLWTGHFITERARAEEELRKRDEELRKRERELAEAQSVGHIGSWSWDVREDRLVWSDEAFRVLGFEPQQFPPTLQAFLERVHPDDRESVERATGVAFEARTPHDLVHRIVRPDGAVRFVRAQSVVQVDSAGQPLRVLGTIHDVTEERQAAARDAQRLLRLKQLSELSMMLAGDPATVFARVVRMIGDLFEVPVVGLWEVAGRQLACRTLYIDGRIVSNAADRPMETTPYATVRDCRDIRTYERIQDLFPRDSFLRDHNAYAWCGFPSLDNEGNVVAVTCLVDDKPHEYTEEDQEILRVVGQRTAAEFERARNMAERARMEEDLRENERRLEEAQHMAHVGSYTGDYSGDPAAHRMEWSDEVYRIYEVDPAQRSLSLETVRARTHPDDLALIQKANEDFEREFARSGGIGRYEVEHRLLLPDGRIKYVLVRANTGLGADGKVRTNGTVQDITERKRAEQEREKLQAQLAQVRKLESIGQLAGGVAHDFNNLLTVINGYASLVLNKMHKADPARQAIENILRAGTTATGLVRQLLAFSRKQVLNFESVSLNDTVNDTGKMLRQLVREDVKIVYKLTPEADLAMADRNQIEQVIINLAVNARDAMPAGGTLTIETRRCDHNRASRECERLLPAGDYVQLIVRDTGTGMDDYTRDHLFEPFFTTKDSGKGTGLGLSTVHGIVSQSGGCIRIESEPGRGSAFYVYLPAAEGAPAEAAAPAAEAAEGNEAVLLVEDKEYVRRLTADILRDLGYKVTETEDAEAALAACDGQLFDLLLTDVVMPGISGVKLAERVRAIQPKLKILLMSGYSDDLAELHGAASLKFPFLQKPFTPETLAAKMRETLGSAGRHRRSG